jgi:hypothetical protein
MNDANQPQARSQPQTAAQIRADIDSGATAEKIGFPDPAAAPLGTDDEAAGTPLSIEQISMDAAARPPRPPTPQSDGRGFGIYVAIVVAIIGAFGAAIWVFL